MTTKASDSVLNLVSPPISNLVLLRGTLDNSTIGANVPAPGTFTSITDTALASPLVGAPAGLLTEVVLGSGLAMTGNVLSASTTSSVTFFENPGNPNGNVAGNAPVPQSYCWDTVNHILYACVVTGNAATAIWLPVSGPQPILTQNIDFYVATTGSDSNNGLTSGAPWLTLSHAAATVSKINTNGFTITVHVGPGVYTSTFNIPTIFGGGSVALTATNGTPSNTVISVSNTPCVLLSGSGLLIVNGFQFISGGGTPPVRVGIDAVGGGRINFSNVDFNFCADGHMFASNGGQLYGGGGSYSISAGGGYHMQAEIGGQVQINGANINFTGAPAFGVAFAQVQNAGHIDGVVNSYTGTFASVTGPRYSAETGGSIYVAGGGPNWFPGDSPGDSSTGYYS